jgi:hypothetical protein
LMEFITECLAAHDGDFSAHQVTYADVCWRMLTYADVCCGCGGMTATCRRIGSIYIACWYYNTKISSLLVLKYLARQHDNECGLVTHLLDYAQYKISFEEHYFQTLARMSRHISYILYYIYHIYYMYTIYSIHTMHSICTIYTIYIIYIIGYMYYVYYMYI